MGKRATRCEPISKLLIQSLWRSSLPSEGYSLRNGNWTRSYVWRKLLSQERPAIWARLFAIGSMWLDARKGASIERAKSLRFIERCSSHSQAKSRSLSSRSTSERNLSSILVVGIMPYHVFSCGGPAWRPKPNMLLVTTVVNTMKTDTPVVRYLQTFVYS